MNNNTSVVVSWDIFVALVNRDMKIFSPVVSRIISFTCVSSVMHFSSHSVIVVN